MAKKILFLSLASFSLLFFLIYGGSHQGELPWWTHYQPYLHAILNSICVALLIWGRLSLPNVNKHKKIMLSAFGTQAIFLISYLIYHAFHGDTPFNGQGFVRNLYFFILISHVLLSMVSYPLILFTLGHAYYQNWGTHKKFARITWPIWFYVAFTGVLITVLLKVFSPQ